MESRSEVEARGGLTRLEREQSPTNALDKIAGGGADLYRLGVIKDWRRATADQLGAIMGWSAIQRLPSRDARRASEMPSLIRVAWSAGLLKRSAPSELPLALQANRGAGVMDLLKRLTPGGRTALTSGTGTWLSPQGGGRHDLLATDLLIRVAEFSTEVAAVVPEAGANHASLITGHRGASQWGRPDAARWGDGVISRRDGLQIVVELTCTVGDAAKLRRKVKGCVDLLLQARFAAVLFVEADHAGGKDQTVWNHLRRAVSETVTTLTKADAGLIRGRLGVARWKWWWPAAQLSSDTSLTLAAECPTGHAKRPWDTLHFLDDFDLPLHHPATADGRKRLRTAVSSPSNPYWLRDQA
jgi:hypothetical protein